MRFIGIDPGVHGGIAKITTDGNLAVLSYSADPFDKMTEAEVAGKFRLIKAAMDSRKAKPVVLIEKQGTRPTDSRPGVAKLHHQCGVLHGIMYALRIPFEDLPPANWQKTFKLLQPKGTPATVKKNKHKAAAARLFPEVVMTHSIADALLIAEHARRLYLKGVACG